MVVSKTSGKNSNRIVENGVSNAKERKDTDD